MPRFRHRGTGYIGSTRQGQHWNVAPVFLRKAKSDAASADAAASAQVINLPGKPV